MTALGANLRPCAFTVPNWPDYDDSCGGCMGYGTWVSGGSWSTAEARAILAHYRQGRHDLAAGSMARILDPYAKLFKLACQDSAEDFPRLDALLFTAMAWILIPAYCFAIP